MADKQIKDLPAVVPALADKVPIQTAADQTSYSTISQIHDIIPLRQTVAWSCGTRLVDSIDQELDFAIIYLQPDLYPSGSNFSLEGVIAVTGPGLTVHLELIRLSDSLLLTNLSTTSLGYVRFASPPLTVGAGGLVPTGGLYVVRLRVTGGTLNTERALLGSAIIGVK